MIQIITFLSLVLILSFKIVSKIVDAVIEERKLEKEQARRKEEFKSFELEANKNLINVYYGKEIIHKDSYIESKN